MEEERQLSQQEMEENAENKKVVAENKKQYMTFRSSEEVYGISLDNVNEIIGLQQYTSVPETEDYIMGLINLRGKVIPVIDIRIRFGRETIEYTDRTSVIVIQVKDTVIGLIVDGVEGVVDIADSAILSPPTSVSDLRNQAQKYVFAIGKVDSEVKLLLDPEKLIFDTVEEEIKPEEDEDEEE